MSKYRVRDFELDKYINKYTLPKMENGKSVSNVERMKKVKALTDEGTEFDKYFLELFDYLYSFNKDGMLRREKNSYCNILESKLEYLEDIANYLLINKENDNLHAEYPCYNKAGLGKKYYRNDIGKEKRERQYNMFSVSTIRRIANNESDNFSDTEWMEYQAFQNGYTMGETDKYNEVIDLTDSKKKINNQKDLLNDVTSELSDEEKEIVRLRSIGSKKVDIARALNLTESQLKARFKRIKRKGNKVMARKEIGLDGLFE